MNYSTFVGGEFYTDHRWLLNQPSLSMENMLFLNGGKACLILIGDYLLAHGIDKILLPAYLCPTIVTTLAHRGLQLDFYRMNEDLSLDLEDMSRKIEGQKAAYFINYFGFRHSAETINLFTQFQQRGILVIEDNAQAGFAEKTTGDFVFNSIRKLTGNDGGYLFTQKDITPYLEKHKNVPNRRLPIIREYRRQLYQYLFEEQGSYHRLKTLFNQAERYYASDNVVWGDPQEKAYIERLDWTGMKKARRENYRYLLEQVASIPEINPIFPSLQADNLPLGLPVYFKGVERDAINAALGAVSISLTIHWDEILTHPLTRSNHQAVEMAQRMLTLTIDQRTSRQQLDYLVAQLKQAIASAPLIKMGK
jgi:dTDP-4-amino-4,6-dideoxygalactose transaminase